MTRDRSGCQTYNLRPTNSDYLDDFWDEVVENSWRHRRLRQIII